MEVSLARYFSFVGGALLALLFISDSYLPKLPIPDRIESKLPVIRIRSDHKWPERIIYDTSYPTITPHTEKTEVSILLPRTVSELSAKPQLREAFAQLQPSSADRPQASNLKKREPKLQRKHRTAKRRASPQTIVVAREPQFGSFGNIW